MRARSPISVFAGMTAGVALLGFASGAALALEPPVNQAAQAQQKSAALSMPIDRPAAVVSKAAPAVTPATVEPFDIDHTPTGTTADTKGSAKLDPLSSWLPGEKPLHGAPAPVAEPSVAAAQPAGKVIDTDGSKPDVLRPNTSKPDVSKQDVPNKAAKNRDDKEFGLDPEPDIAIKPPPVVPVAEPAPAVPPKPVNTNALVPDEPLPPLAAAIKVAIEKRGAVEIKGANAGERRRQREAIAFFYVAHAFAPVWSTDGVPVAAVDPVLARLAHAGDDALVLASAPAVLKIKGTPQEIAESELALSEAVVAYARQATGSRIEPRTIAPLIGLKPDLADATEALETVAAAGTDAGDRLRAFNPAEPRYLALREKLSEMRAAHTPATASTIPAGPDLKIGMSDPRVPLIRARFSPDGAPDGKPQDLRYDTEVAAAVAGFQKANGLPASGVLTKRTIAALSGGRPSRLEGELVANMELWRWMPRDLGANRVEVNVPDFVVTVFRDGAPISTNRVVVGKTDTPTPLFSNKMQYVIVNPVWNVPESIIKKEMLPRLARDPGYLDRLGYTVTQKNGRLVVKQPSGERNALGRVKFIFPNDYAVYLHDTPSKALFASTRRAFSHGCVRVDQPFRFGESILGADRGWSEKRLKGMLGDKERYVSLPTALPIHIEYFTASVDDSGRLNLRDDVYDYVHRIALALGQEG